MDRKRFDSLTRLFATTGSRRRAISALLAAAVLGENEDVLGKNKKKSKGNKHKARDKSKRSRRQRNDDDHASDEAASDAAVADPSAPPSVAAESKAADRGGSKRGKSKKGKGRGKKGKNRARDKDTKSASRGTRCRTGVGPEAAPEVESEATTTCCGTKSCPLPTKGSNSYECNFEGQNLSNRDMSGASLGKINGKKTNFSGSNVSRANFGSACLQGRTSRTPMFRRRTSAAPASSAPTLPAP